MNCCTKAVKDGLRQEGGDASILRQEPDRNPTKSRQVSSVTLKLSLKSQVYTSIRSIFIQVLPVSNAYTIDAKINLLFFVSLGTRTGTDDHKDTIAGIASASLVVNLWERN